MSCIPVSYTHLGEFVHNFPRLGVIRPRGVEHVLCRRFLAERELRPLCDRRRRAICFQTALTAAVARSAVGMKRHVSENSRRVRVYGAAFQPAVDDETASHSRAEGEPVSYTHLLSARERCPTA